jgi:hypothetical protein
MIGFLAFYILLQMSDLIGFRLLVQSPLSILVLLALHVSFIAVTVQYLVQANKNKCECVTKAPEGIALGVFVIVQMLLIVSVPIMIIVTWLRRPVD